MNNWILILVYLWTHILRMLLNPHDGQGKAKARLPVYMSATYRRHIPNNKSNPGGSLPPLETRKVFLNLLIEVMSSISGEKMLKWPSSKNDSFFFFFLENSPRNTTQTKLLKMQHVWVPFDHVIYIEMCEGCYLKKQSLEEGFSGLLWYACQTLSVLWLRLPSQIICLSTHSSATFF